MKILIVEDQGDIRDVLLESLGEAGHEITLAADFDQGAAALAAAGSAGLRWDLLLADLMLPGGSGLELAARALADGLRVLLCSGHPLHMARFELSGVPFLRKPFTLRHLHDQIAAVMAAPLPSVGATHEATPLTRSASGRQNDAVPEAGLFHERP